MGRLGTDRLARRSVLAAVLAVPLVAGVASSAASAASAASSGLVTPARYVALGDSYTSAPLVGPVAGGPLGCLRSVNNYPHLVQQALRAAAFTDMSCGGATTDNLTAAQPVLLGSNPPQLSALSPDTDVVTAGIGGNDIGSPASS